MADTGWISECAKNGWVIISGDDSIERVPEELQAVINGKWRVLMFDDSNSRTDEWAAAFIVGHNRIMELVEKANGSFSWSEQVCEESHVEATVYRGCWWRWEVNRGKNECPKRPIRRLPPNRVNQYVRELLSFPADARIDDDDIMIDIETQRSMREQETVIFPIMKLNIGCGTSGARGWQNFDNSPTIWLARVPLARKFLHLPNWPNDVRRHNVLNGLPFPDSSVDCIYSSHTFEHFTFEESLKLAKECWRVLKFHGIFRLAVPDLRIAVNEYLASSEPMASHQFVGRLLLGGGLRDLIHPGNHHNQMFDANSLAFLFRQAGFHLPEVKQFGDSAIPDIAEIELESRKHETLYVEALKFPESP